MIDLFTEYEFTIYAGVILSLLALSTYLTVAVGVVSVAAPAYMAIGAYTSALTTIHWELPFPLALVLAIVAAGAAGGLVALPAARLGALYLTLMTFAVVEIVTVLIVLLSFTGGAGGLTGIPPHTTGGWIFGSFVVVCLVVWRLRRSQSWRLMSAVRQSEVGASSLGIGVARLRFVLFVLSGAIAGLAGALSAHLDLVIGPETYGFSLIIGMLAAVYLGGAGVWYGPILGAALVTALPEVLRPLQDARDYVYGAIFIVVLIWAPGGLAVGLRRLLAPLRRAVVRPQPQPAGGGERDGR